MWKPIARVASREIGVLLEERGASDEHHIAVGFNDLVWWVRTFGFYDFWGLDSRLRTTRWVTRVGKHKAVWLGRGRKERNKKGTAKHDLVSCLDNLISSHVYTTSIHLIFFSTVNLTLPNSRLYAHPESFLYCMVGPPPHSLLLEAIQSSVLLLS